MKGLLAAIAILILSSQSIASEWHFISKSGDSMIYMDFSSITSPSPSKKRAWVLYVAENNETTKDFEAYDCANRESATISSVKYNAKGEPIQNFTDPKPHFTPIVPDSVGETAFLVVCDLKVRAKAAKRNSRALDPQFDAQIRWAPPAPAEPLETPEAEDPDGRPLGCTGKCAGGYYWASLKNTIFQSDCQSQSNENEFLRGCYYRVEQAMRRRADGK